MLNGHTARFLPNGLVEIWNYAAGWGGYYDARTLAYQFGPAPRLDSDFVRQVIAARNAF